MHKEHKDTAQSVAPSIVLTEKDIQRYWKFVDKQDSCWIWMGRKNKGGYGVLDLRKQVLAHRVSYQIHYGNIPHRLCICHTCDIRKCVNPGHLWLGSQIENIRDMDEKGRRRRRSPPKGEINGGAILTEKEVFEILYRLKNGEKSIPLSKEYGVSRKTVYAIRSRRLWKHVDYP